MKAHQLKSSIACRFNMYMHSIQIVDWKSTHNLCEPRCLPGVLLGTETRLDYLTCRHRHKEGHSLSWKTYHVVFSSILQLTSCSAFCPETKLSLPHLRPALELVQYWIVVLWAFLVLKVSVEILCFFFLFQMKPTSSLKQMNREEKRWKQRMNRSANKI